jgi:hypothetical protein
VGKERRPIKEEIDRRQGKGLTGGRTQAGPRTSFCALPSRLRLAKEDYKGLETRAGESEKKRSGESSRLLFGSSVLIEVRLCSSSSSYIGC